jgi:hypothetical protein
VAGRSLRIRLGLTGAVLAAAGVGTALALGAAGGGGPATIDADSGAPLFALRAMRPGDPAVQRCIAVTATGGSAPRLAVSATVAGALAAELRMDVAAGEGPAPGDAHSCAGFVPERELWTGALADFPTQGAPAIDAAALLSGARRVYRFRVELPAAATGAGGAQASQDIRWTAELEPSTPPGETTAPATGAGGTAGIALLRCAMLVGGSPRRSLTIGGHRVTFLAAASGLIAADAPLALRVSSPAGVVRSVTYTVDGRAVPAGHRSPWSARVAPSLLHTPRTRLVATITPAHGRTPTTTLAARVRSCPTLAHARASGVHPRAITMRLDSASELRGATITLPAALAPGTPRGRIITWAGGQRRVRGLATTASPSVRTRGRGLEIAGLPADTSIVELTVNLPSRRWRALAAARCARARLTTRIATGAGVVTVRHRLLGPRARCAST